MLHLRRLLAHPSTAACFLTIAVLLTGCLPRSGVQAPSSATVSPSEEQTRLRVAHTYGKLPLGFEANRGQTDPRVDFISRGSGYTLFLTSAEAVFSLLGPFAPPSGDEPTVSKSYGAVLRMQLVGANAAPAVVGLDELLGKVNYLLGNDPSQWRTDLPTYGKVAYRDVYPGVDLFYYGNQGQLEYDFVVSPGADPRSVVLGFEGAEGLELDASGNLILHTPAAQVQLKKPVAYQQLGAQRQAVDGSFVLEADQQVSFAIGAYDPTRPLVIDPVLVYATYLGGSGHDWGGGVAADALGYAYVAGQTLSTNFPTTAGALQPGSAGSVEVFVAKLNPEGTSLVYSTYLGGSGHDGGGGVALEPGCTSDCVAYVGGSTYSTDFPITAGAYQTVFRSAVTTNPDGFVVKLNAQGNDLIYSTYLGGSNGEFLTGIAVDGAGATYVTGYSQESYGDPHDFPTTPGAFQEQYAGGATEVFVTKLNAAGSARVYSTYLGGSVNGNARELGLAIALESGCPGNCAAYVTGGTDSTNFPTTAGALQPSFAGGTGDAEVFVTKLNAAGSALDYSTYLGGSGNETARGLAVDSTGNAYVVGQTDSSNFPTTPGALQPGSAGSVEAFVTKLNPQGTSLVYSTYLGGSGGAGAADVAVDSAGHAYVGGSTASMNFPTLNPLPGTSGTGAEAFVAKLNAQGNALLFSTRLGGTGNDNATAIALDPTGNIYLTGTAGNSFPTTPGTYQPLFAGGDSDAFVAKIADNQAPVCVSPPSGLVSWWPANGNGNDITSSNHGMLLNGATFGPGKVGQAFQLDGADDYVHIGNQASLKINDSITIGAWVNPRVAPAPDDPAHSGLYTIVTKWGQSVSADSYGLWLHNPDGTIRLISSLAVTSSGLTVRNGGAIPSGSWSHVAMTYDRTSGVQRLYVNGMPAGESQGSGGIRTSDLSVQIGKEDSYLPRFFNGSIDEVQIFNRALTADEIQAIYNADSAGLCESDSHDPPVTTAHADPAQNAQGTYPGPVTITLNAAASAGFAVDTTHYVVDGGATQNYTGPFVISTEGSHVIEYWSIDSSGLSELRKTLNIQIVSLGITTQSPLPSGPQGQAYSFDLDATGGTAPYTWAVIDGTSPLGLSLDPDTGTITGTPTAAANWQFTVLVVDAENRTATKVFDLAVQPVAPPTGLFIVTDSALPGGTVGTFYSVVLIAEGGVEPYTWSVIGTLPPGLELDESTGEIRGVPTTAGTFSFTIQVTDSSGSTAEKPFAITPPPSSGSPGLPYTGPIVITPPTDPTTPSSGCTNYAVVSGTLPDGLTLDQSTGLITGTPTVPGAYTFVVQCTTGNNQTATKAFSITITGSNQPPTAIPGDGYNVLEGGTRVLNGQGTDADADGDSLSFVWDLNNDGIFETPEQTPTFSAVGRDGPSSQTVVLRVCDSHNTCASAATAVLIQNVAPSATFHGDGPVNEGDSFALKLTDPTDPSSADVAAGFTYAFNCGDGNNYSEFGTANSTTCPTTDNGTRLVAGKIRDKDGDANEYTAEVLVENAPPTVAPITVSPANVIEVGTAINAAAVFTDPGTADTHTCTLNWGDALEDVAGTVANGQCSGNHTYTSPGVYTIVMKVVDDDGGMGSATYQFVVVYDPSGGFVTGGGWLMSPLGAFVADPMLTGKANFGFVSKYEKGAKVATGQTEFLFKLADLNFHSKNYEWLVVGGARAQYKGTGTINGSGDYGFILTAVDGQINGGGGTDKFRIKIWDRASGTVVYDNQIGAVDDATPTTTLGGGSIVIHKGANEGTTNAASVEGQQIFVPLVGN